MQAGHEVVILDNLCNSRRDVVNRIGRIVGWEPAFVEGDVRDRSLVRRLLNDEGIDGVMHFAGLKAVGESVAQPLAYYDCNVCSTIALFESMVEAGVKVLVFSSSATVYGYPKTVPISEDFPCSATNPYGRSKLIIEDILSDLLRADPAWCIACLRYFNPVGAHESGMIGEAPLGVPNNLVPYITDVAAGRRERLEVFGDDYSTRDGTGVRDYIHVMDMAEGHVAALNALVAKSGMFTVNLGTGCGYTVLEMVRAFAAASGKEVPYVLSPRRPGDVAECYADATLASTLLNWQAKRDIHAMCRDTWRWEQWRLHSIKNML
jgi:UDP-glucose 4-epimerase